MTTAPSAPSASSSHMNQNRCCPGVPNRYTTRSSRIVIRPKSMATVVVDFCSTPYSESTSSLRSLSVSSVRSGRISLTEPTSVVLPAPKPPAMRILRAVRTGSAVPRSDSSKAIDNLLEDLEIAEAGGLRAVNRDDAALAQVRDENPDHAHGQVQVGREVDDRSRN